MTCPRTCSAFEVRVLYFFADYQLIDKCVEDYFETFVQVYDEHFSRQYGFWRRYVEQVIYRYHDCGDLHNGICPL
jgi:hypothetical protein